MKTLILNIIVISLLALVSCNNSTEVNNTIEENLKIEEEVLTIDVDKELMTIEQGKNFAMQTQKVLGKNLVKAIKEQGTVHALNFCKAEAFPLTDSMALALNVKLKRVTDKPRNPNNQANIHEMIYLEKLEELLANGETIKPEIKEEDGKIIAYYPIITNQLCMQCHGEQDVEILSETLLHIKEIYPEDKAVDYKINELRGIWVVEMIKEKEESVLN